MRKALLWVIFGLFASANTHAQSGIQTPLECPTYYQDADQDSFGNPLVFLASCTGAPVGYVANSLDCNDTSAQVSPNAGEIGYNLQDDDCDGSIDEGFVPKIPNVSAAVCGTELQAIKSYIYCTLIAGVSGYRWKVTTLTGPDAGLVQYLNTPLRCFRITQLPIYSFDTSYKIQVAVYYNGYLQPFSSADCVVTTPVTLSWLTQCPTVLTSINDIIYARYITQATAYRFRITDPVNSANTEILERALREFRMYNITSFVVQYGKTYNVDVSFRTADGQWSPYGPVCTVTTPIFPTVRLLDEYCSDAFGYPYEPATMDEQIWAEFFPGALLYYFKLQGPGLPAAGVEFGSTQRWTKLKYFAGLIPGETYNISVRIVFSYYLPPGPYGKVCTIRVPLIANLARIEAEVSPNPFEDSFRIVLHDDRPHRIRLADLYGRILIDEVLSAADISEREFGEKLPSDLYLLTVDNRNWLVKKR